MNDTHIVIYAISIGFACFVGCITGYIDGYKRGHEVGSQRYHKLIDKLLNGPNEIQ